jgi:hypothetical protein
MVTLIDTAHDEILAIETLILDRCKMLGLSRADLVRPAGYRNLAKRLPPPRRPLWWRPEDHRIAERGHFGSVGGATRCRHRRHPSNDDCDWPEGDSSGGVREGHGAHATDSCRVMLGTFDTMPTKGSGTIESSKR